MSVETRLQALEQAVNNSKQVNELASLGNITGSELLAIYDTATGLLKKTLVSNLLQQNEFRGREVTTNIDATTLKSYKNGIINVTSSIDINLDDTFNNDFNVIIKVSNGSTVTINTTNATIDDSSISDGQIAILYKKNQVNEFFNTLIFDANQAGGGGIVDSDFSDTSTNPLENRKVSTLRNFTQKFNTNLSVSQVEALSNQHIICEGKMDVNIDDTLPDSYNLLISVKQFPDDVTIVAGGNATVNLTKLTPGVYFLTKVKATNDFHVEVVRRDFEIISHTGNTFDINTKAGKIFYESFSSTSPYSSSPKAEDPINLNIGENGSWAVINSNTSGEPVINNNTDSRPIRYLAGGNQWSEDGLSGSTIDIIIQVLPFEIQVSYRLIAT